ncbi:MAG: radical SAM protein [Firmicutes bacterium]|nr:radical SAM protein [Bacillota bacterium]
MDYKLHGMNIELTTACPLHCPQCYCTLEGGKHIPLETAKKMLAEAASLGVQHVELSGGETLCYPHLVELVAYARSLDIAPSIAISGWHFDARVLQELVDAGIDMICLSLNGPTQVLNAPTRDGYDYSIQALKILQENHYPDTYINWVMHRDLVEYLPDMIALAESYDASGFLIIEPKPTAAHELNTSPTAEQMLYVADFVKKYRGSLDINVQHCFSPLAALVGENKLWGNRNRGPYKGCTAGIVSLSVNVDGQFSPCRHLDYFESWDSIQEYWEKSPVLKQIRDLGETKTGPCETCRLAPYCRPCMAANSKIEGKISIGNRYCALHKALA